MNACRRVYQCHAEGWSHKWCDYFLPNETDGRREFKCIHAARSGCGEPTHWICRHEIAIRETNDAEGLA